MQNSFQVIRDLRQILGPNGLDVDGAQQSLNRRTEMYNEIKADQANEAEQKAIADKATSTDEVIMGLPTPQQDNAFEVISDADKAKADEFAANKPEMPMGENPEADDGGFAEAVEGENAEREMRGASGDKALAPEKASPGQVGQDQEVRPQGHWKGSGLPGSNLFETPQDAYKYFMSIGNEMSAKIAMTSIRGEKSVEKGLIETTSPLEFVLTGMGAMGSMALNQGLRQTGKYIGGASTRAYTRYMKSFAASSPVEFAATVGAEELAEDSPFVGIAAEVLFGVGTGVATDLAMDVFRPSWGSKVEESIQDVLMTAYQPTPKKVPGSGGPIAPDYGMATMRTSKDGAPRTPRTAAEYAELTGSTPKLNSKQAQSAETTLKAKVAKGDLRDPATRQVYQAAIAKAKQTELKSSEAEAAYSLETKIAKLDAEEPISPDNPIGAEVAEGLSPSTTIPKAPVPERTDSAASASEAFKTPEARAEAGSRFKSARYTAVKRRIEETWYGKNNEDFEEDVAFKFNQQLKAARDAGTPITGKRAKALQGTIRTDTRLEYDQAIEAESWTRLTEIENTSWASSTKRNTDMALPGAHEKYADFPGQITRREQTTGDTTSPYEYKDYDVTDHLVFTDDGTGLVLRSDMPEVGPQPKEPFKLPPKFAPAIDYSRATDKSTVMNLLASKFKYWADSKRKVFHGKGVRPDFPAADKLKVDTEIWSVEAADYITIKALPDSEEDAIAKLYGWNDSMVKGYTFQAGEHINAPSRINTDGDINYTVNKSAEDILQGRQDFLASEEHNPGWFDYQKRLPHASSTDPTEYAVKQGDKTVKVQGAAETKDPEFYGISSGVSAYREQRKAYLEQMFNLTSQRMGTGEKNKYYYSMMEQIAVMRNDIMKDIRVLHGTNYGPHAKRTYLAFGDMIAGTDHLGVVSRYSEGQLRQKALWEYDQFKNSGPTDVEKTDTFIAQRMEDTGETYEEASAALRRADVGDARDRDIEATQALDADEAGQVSDVAGAPMGGRVIDTGEPDISVPTRASSTGAATPKGIGRLTMDLDEDMLNAQVIKLEDQMGVRVADTLWDVSEAGGTGKLNIWRLNSMDDINALFMKLDQPMVARDGGTNPVSKAIEPIDTKLVFGVEAAPSHSPDFVQRLAMVMKDTQQQMDELAKDMAASPGQASTGLAWLKLQSINSMMATNLASGKPSEGSLKAFKDLDLYANSNKAILEKTMNATNNVMPLGVDGMPSTKMVSMYAEMFTEMPNSARKAGLLRRLDEGNGYELNDLYQSQRKVTKMLTEACG